MKKFLSDNNTPVHPKVMERLSLANEGDVFSYGDDPWTEEAIRAVQNLFSGDPDVYFVTNGTAANIIGLSGILKPWESVICTSLAHINTDECGAFERLTGNKIIPVHKADGKLTPADILPLLHAQGVEHIVEHRVVSISNVTETGTLYTPSEIRELADFCHDHNMLLHLDGARIANAAAKLGVSIAALSEEAGVDVLSFGGTKNGLMIAEAIVVFTGAKTDGYRYLRKQSMQLVSKHRYLSAQFLAYLEDDLYLKNAEQANQMTEIIRARLLDLGVTVLNRESYANILFMRLPQEAYEKLEEKYPLHVEGEVQRIVTSFNTTQADVEEFLGAIKDSLKGQGGAMLHQYKPETEQDLIYIIKTNRGDIHVRLFPEVAPKTVQNFTEHAKNGYYDNGVFHRVIKDFMIQGGDPTGTGRGGVSIYGETFEDEFDNDARNFYGAISMANRGPNTNGSQFFIVTVPNTPDNIIEEMKSVGEQGGYSDEIISAYKENGGAYWLDGKHAVFGHVISGMDIVDGIGELPTDRMDRPMEEVKILSIEAK